MGRQSSAGRNRFLCIQSQRRLTLWAPSELFSLYLHDATDTVFQLLPLSATSVSLANANAYATATYTTTFGTRRSLLLQVLFHQWMRQRYCYFHCIVIATITKPTTRIATAIKNASLPSASNCRLSILNGHGGTHSRLDYGVHLWQILTRIFVNFPVGCEERETKWGFTS